MKKLAAQAVKDLCESLRTRPAIEQAWEKMGSDVQKEIQLEWQETLINYLELVEERASCGAGCDFTNFINQLEQ